MSCASYGRVVDTPRAVELTDPATMRVLAHPTRMRLLGELRINGPASVGALCLAVDEAPGSVSYHLSRLADVGLVAQAPELAPDRRQRWWRAVHELTITRAVEDRGDPERAAAGTALRRSFVREMAKVHDTHLAEEHTLPVDWARASVSGDRYLHLTVTELARLSAELEEFWERWAAVSDASRDDARAVTALYAAFPRP